MYGFEIGDEVVVQSKITGVGPFPGLVSFMDPESKTMTILIGRGCIPSENTKLVVVGSDIEENVKKGWGELRKVAQESLEPRQCSWYDQK